MKLKFTLLLCGALGLLLATGAAKNPPKNDKNAGGPAFSTDPFFRFGMNLADAETHITARDWQTIYRIDTPSTNEIAAVFQEHTFYHLGFFEGKCYLLEKRTQLPLADVQQIFTSMGTALGETPEATQSDDGSLIFSRWTLRDREISLTADQGEGDIFKLTYEEVDPMLSGEAEHTQEQEVSSTVKTTIDPLTGKPIVMPSDPSADPAADNADAAGDGTAAGDAKGDPKGDGKGDAKGEGKDKAAEGGDEDKAAEDSNINRNDPNDW